MSANGATRRVNSGRGHKYLMDGEDADGVTNVLSEGVPKPALIGWAFNVARDYVTDHWDELTQLPRSQRIKLIDKARYASRDAAANKGTAIHNTAVLLQAGQEVDVPEEIAGHVDSYLKFAEEWKPREHLVEVVVLNRRYRYMGTLDLVATLKDGKRWLLDWKSTQSGVRPENALQLAAYRNAESYIGPDGGESPMLPVDRCGVVWLRADGYDLVPVEAGPEMFRAFLYAQEVARWRQIPREDIVREALTP